MKLSDILGAGCIACGPDAIEVLQRGLAETLASARTAGIIGDDDDDLSSLAQAAHQHSETSSSVLDDLSRLPARYSALVFLQWAARDLQRALERAPDWYEVTARGLLNLTYADAILYAHGRDKAALAFDRWKNSGAGATARRTSDTRANDRKAIILQLAEQYIGRINKIEAAELIAPRISLDPHRTYRLLTQYFPGNASIHRT